MVAYSVCLLKRNGLLLHHKWQSSLSPMHPFLCDSWIVASGTELGPFSSPEAIHFGWGD